MNSRTTIASALALSLAAVSYAATAAALPGFYVGKRAAQRSSYATHVVIAKKGDRSVVTVAADYDGPLEPFAFVMPVPADVTADRVKILKRGNIDRIEQITAPRFHEFWETDPCDSGPVEQEWERNLAVTDEGMFGGGPVSGEDKVPKEMLLTVVPEFMSDKEYGSTLLGDEDSKNLGEWLKKGGYVPPDGMDAAIAPYVQAGMHMLVMAVDANRIELVGGSRAELLPIRFWTEKPYDAVPTALGLMDLDKTQDLVVYVLGDQRYEAKDRPNVYPPTNIKVDFVVKERMGEFYNGLTDIILAKHPGAVLDEFAWSADGCGQPCPDEPLGINEILTFGGDVFEATVSDEDRNPKPPDQTDEEKKKEEAKLKEEKPADRPKLKKQFAADRKELARRKALIERNKFTLTRLHLHYDKTLSGTDVKFGPASGPIEGGMHVPKGRNADIPTEVVNAKENRFQTRYIFMHPWEGMMQCPSPDRWRWGKPPRTYRGLRKIWVAEDLQRKSRTQIKPAEVVQTAIPDLGLAAAPSPSALAAASASAAAAPSASAAAGEGDAKKSSCGCTTPGRHSTTGLGGALALGLALALARRRQAR